MKQSLREYRYWIAGLIGLCGYLGYSISIGPKTHFIPGETTHGHHQIEMSCSECHTPSMGVLQDACTKCHAEELERVNDSHPVVKFKDPRNAARLEHIEATKCVSCHREHQPEITRDMGVTLPTDYCYHCHQKIGEQRPSHQGMGFDTCATAGCHNFHDNSSLYERFLTDHLDEPDFKQMALTRARDLYDSPEGDALVEANADMPEDVEYSHQILHDWSSTAHARAGVNCTSCHNVEDEESGQMLWQDDPGYESCQECHEHETQGFLEGKHGMRLALGLSPMTPGMAKIPMRPEAAHRELSCASCHEPHRFNTNYAAVDACLNCHNDEHSLAYKDSKHYQLFVQASKGLKQDREAVSCATCHMPRVERSRSGETFTLVDHNQNNSLRPNEKMVRSSCIQCHGLQLTLNALADEDLIRRNFQGMPSTFVDSLEMAREEKRLAEEREKKQQEE